MDQEVFTALQPYLGDVLQLRRILHRVTPEQVAEALRSETGQEFDAHDITCMEQGVTLIDQPTFQALCHLFHTTEVQLLKAARHYYEATMKSQEEVHRELKAELDYRKWEIQQRRSRRARWFETASAGWALFAVALGVLVAATVIGLQGYVVTSRCLLAGATALAFLGGFWAVLWHRDPKGSQDV